MYIESKKDKMRNYINRMQETARREIETLKYNRAFREGAVVVEKEEQMALLVVVEDKVAKEPTMISVNGVDCINF